ncbi:MAG: PAS domain S-box protein [Sediminispirochaetaceae bacterium]
MSKKILLVEDEALIALNEAKMLERHGFAVSTVYSGEGAVEAVDSDSEISLVLMDIDLGRGMDGTEAAERILEKHDLPIAFLSSHTEAEVVEKTEGITSYGYIVKNSGKTVLLASIKMAFRLYEAHMELKRQKEHLNTTLIKYEQSTEELAERETLYRNLMENSIDGVELLDEEGNYLNANRKECEMLGYSREELLGMKIADIDPNYPEEGFYRFWKEQPKGTSILFETLHRHKNGTLIPVEVNGIFFTVENKKYIFGLARDIRERKRAEYEIKAREENLRITLDSIGDAVISTDFEGRIVRMNPVAENLCGWSINEARGKALKEVFHIIHAGTGKIVENPVARVLETGNIIGLANHTMLISKDGTEYQIADSAAPIQEDDGNTTGVVLVFRDVTKEYEKERQLKERVKELGCLYQISKTVEEKEITLEGILQKTAAIIPDSLQYPEICTCRITLQDKKYQSKRFKETVWKLQSDVVVAGEVLGTVEVYYLEEKPEFDEGPFLKEERVLIDAVTEHLGRIIESKQNEEELSSIEWMLSKKTTKQGEYVPEYGDLSTLNKDGLILHTVGKEQLRDIANGSAMSPAGRMPPLPWRRTDR